MDPNNSQPVETNPVAQPLGSPMAPTEASIPAPTSELANTSPAPKEKSSKVIILLVILLLLMILIIGIVSYFLFTKDQLNKAQRATTDNTSIVLPSPTPIPTEPPQANLDVESPEKDLMELDADVKGL